jgi:hypothetical protein
MSYFSVVLKETEPNLEVKKIVNFKKKFSALNFSKVSGN